MKGPSQGEIAGERFETGVLQRERLSGEEKGAAKEDEKGEEETCLHRSPRLGYINLTQEQGKSLAWEGRSSWRSTSRFVRRSCILSQKGR